MAIMVETGSFHSTVAAMKTNAENMILLRNAPDNAKVYMAEWVRLWDEAKDRGK